MTTEHLKTWLVKHFSNDYLVGLIAILALVVALIPRGAFAESKHTTPQTYSVTIHEVEEQRLAVNSAFFLLLCGRTSLSKEDCAERDIVTLRVNNKTLHLWHLDRLLALLSPADNICIQEEFIDWRRRGVDGGIFYLPQQPCTLKLDTGEQIFTLAGWAWWELCTRSGYSNETCEELAVTGLYVPSLVEPTLCITVWPKGVGITHGFLQPAEVHECLNTITEGKSANDG